MNIPAIEPFVIDDSESLNFSRKWKTYKDKFQLYILASGVSQVKQNNLLYYYIFAVKKSVEFIIGTRGKWWWYIRKYNWQGGLNLLGIS